VGFAWTPKALGNKTVVRGGFGILVDPIQLPTPNQQGFSQSTSANTTTDSYLTPTAGISNPFPTGIQQPTGSSKGVNTFLGQSLTFYNPKPLNPYTVRWQLSIQRQLPFSTVLELAYIGSHAMHLLITRQQDAIPGQYLSKSLVRDNTVINQLSALVTNPF
jgi:hypothetical protein